MKPTTSYAVNGDRVLITLEVDASSVTASDPARISITLDDEEWHDAAKRVLRENQAAERGLLPDLVADNVERSLHRAIDRAGRVDQDPDLLRRRAATNILHRLADLVLNGSVRRFEVRWDGVNTSTVGVETGRGDRARIRDMILAIDPAKMAT